MAKTEWWPFQDEVNSLVSPVLEEELTVEERVCGLKELTRYLMERQEPDEPVVAERTALLLLSESWFVVTDPAVFEELFIQCVLACGTPTAVSAAIQTLRTVADSSASLFPLDLCLLVLRRVLYTSRSTDWLGSNTRSLDQWANSLVLLPTIVANACQRHDMPVPSWITKLLVRLAQNCLGHPACACALIPQILRRGGEEVATGLFKSWEEVKNRHDNTIHQVLCGLPSRDFAKLARAMVQVALLRDSGFSLQQNSAQVAWLRPTVAHTIVRNDHHCEAFVKTMLFSERFVNDALVMGQILARLLIDEEHGKKKWEDALLRRHVIWVAEKWVQTDFVLKTPASIQHQATCFLVSALRSLKGKEDPASDLATCLLKGISERLGSLHTVVRQDGMIVAELLAERLGEKLDFEEMEGNRDQYQCSQVVVAASSTTQSSHVQGNELDEAKTIQSDYESSDEDDSLTWDQEDTFLPQYNLDDDEEDLRDTPKPSYLADCLDLLRTPESDELAASKHEAALGQVCPLVRQRPLDLVDMAPALARELLRFEDKFHTDNFSELVRTGLLALAAEEPLAVGGTLIDELFQSGTLQNRMLTLQTLDDAAIEVSGLTSEHKRSDKTNRYVIRIINVSSSHPQLQSSSLNALQDTTTLTKQGTIAVQRTQELQTKRKRTSTPLDVEQVCTNGFVDIGPVWFYSLMGQFVIKRDDKTLWRGKIGAALLSKFFHTLATIVQCSRYAQGVEIMAKDLVDLVWSFRGADVAEVRNSVLLALTAGFGSLRENDMLSLLYDDSPDSLTVSLPQIALSDPDENCRHVARSFLEGLVQSRKLLGY